MHLYTANGNVFFGNPFSLSCPSIEKTQWVPTDENASFAFFFLSIGFAFSNPFGSTSVMAVYVWSLVSLTPCTLREKCPNTEFCLVCIFLHSVQIQENTDQKKLGIWILFTKWYLPYLAVHSSITQQLSKPFTNFFDCFCDITN